MGETNEKKLVKLSEQDTGKGCRALSVQVLDRGGTIVDTASGDERACHVAMLTVYDQGPRMERTQE